MGRLPVSRVLSRLVDCESHVLVPMPLSPPIHKPKGSETQAQRRQRFDTQRDKQPYRQWYKTKRWQSLRWSVLVRDNFTCQMCGKLEPNTSQLVADHTEPHRGDQAKFWGGALKTLCKPCHDSLKQRQEANQ